MMTQHGTDYEVTYDGIQYIVELEANLIRPEYHFPRTEFEVDLFRVYVEDKEVTSELHEQVKSDLLEILLDRLVENEYVIEYD